MGLLDIVDQRVDEDDEIGRLELQAVKIRPPMPLPVDHVGDDAVGLIAVLGLVELVAERLGEVPCRVLGLVRLGREKGPVRRIEAMRMTVPLSRLGSVVMVMNSTCCFIGDWLVRAWISAMRSACSGHTSGQFV